MNETILITIVITGISLIYFFYIGLRSSYARKSDEDYFLANRKISGSNLTNTWAISSISFGATILYYMQIVNIWGFWVLIGSILTYVIGQFFSLKLATSAKVDLSKFRTIGVFVNEKLEHKSLGRFIDILNFIAAWALLYIELGLGVKIVSIFFPETNLFIEIAILLTLSLIIFGYIYLGGFKAIIESDKWQLRLVLLGTLAISFVAFAVLYDGAENNRVLINLLPTASNEQIIMYILFAAIVNFTYAIPQAQIWQRLAATEKGQKPLMNGLKGIMITALFFALYVIIAGVYRADGTIITAPIDIFSKINLLGNIGNELIYPLVFNGFICAMISTADSAAFSGIYSIFATRDFENETEWPKVRKKSNILLIFMLISVIMFYVLFEVYFNGYLGIFLSIIFYLFSQLTIASPVVIGILLFKPYLRKKNIIFYGTIISWIFLTVTTISGVFGEGLIGNLYSTSIAFVMCILFTFKFKK